MEWPTLPNSRTPNGLRHEVGVDELFFSTTDQRGVITESNEVFVRLSRFVRDELIGAPHSIIRHPAMPKGAFKLMWDMLGAGEPFCAYVENLAADGSTYRVFATITPIPGGYLSVRSRPMAEPFREAALALYANALPMELAARDEGLTSREAAGVGLGKLAADLAGAGFATYEEFIWQSLPAEVQARHEAATPLSGCVDEEGPLGDIADAAAELAAELKGWSARQDALHELAEQLASAVPELSESMRDANATATRISDVAAANPSLAPILLSVTVWAAMMDEIDAAVTRLITDLEALRISASRTRFRIALARLHTDSVGQLVAELVDDRDTEMCVVDAIDMLCGALAEGFAQTSTQSLANAEAARAAVADIEEVAGLMAVPCGLIANWTTMSAGRSDSAVVELLPEISHQLNRTQAALALLDSLAGECARVATPQDTSVAAAVILRIEDAVTVFDAPSAPRRAVLD